MLQQTHKYVTYKNLIYLLNLQISRISAVNLNFGENKKYRLSPKPSEIERF